MPAPLPICRALLICDLAHQDSGSGKYTIIGTFSTIGARQFPARHPRMAFFCELSNGHGRIPLTVKLVRTTSEHPDGELITPALNGEAQFGSPKDNLSLAFGVDNLVFPEPGEYRLVVESSGRLISERTITLFRLE